MSSMAAKKLVSQAASRRKSERRSILKTNGALVLGLCTILAGINAGFLRKHILQNPTHHGLKDLIIKQKRLN